MRDYSDQELEAYIATGEPMDKAGAYAVQDMAFRPAAHVEGCYTNVMGLPLCLLVEPAERRGARGSGPTRVSRSGWVFQVSIKGLVLTQRKEKADLDLFGVGMLEVIAILVIALLVLGPLRP